MEASQSDDSGFSSQSEPSLVQLQKFMLENFADGIKLRLHWEDWSKKLSSPSNNNYVYFSLDQSSINEQVRAYMKNDIMLTDWQFTTHVRGMHLSVSTPGKISLVC